MAVLTGCAASKNVTKNEPPPDWVMNPPNDDKRICAVGASEPTYYIEDGKTYATENARKELAKVLHADVNSIMVVIKSEREKDVHEVGVVEAASWATKAVLKESQIVSYWYDEVGIRSSNKKGVMYALACMPRGGVK